MHVDYRSPKLTHTVTAPALIEELRICSAQRETSAFQRRSPPSEVTLTDRDEWVREWRNKTLELTSGEEIAMYVDLALKMGYSQHVAFAINAADWGIKANSFQAAVKKVERYWRRT